jgi:hypothetical protein
MITKDSIFMVTREVWELAFTASNSPRISEVKGNGKKGELKK